MVFRGRCVSFYVHLGSAVEAEGHDKRDINLPGKQLQLLQDTVSAGTDLHYIHYLIMLTVKRQGYEKLDDIFS